MNGLWFSLLSVLFLCIITTPSHSSLCHPFESSALLSFKNSFPVINVTSAYYFCANSNNTISWDMSEDCCSWSGVTCDDKTGHVIGLHLRCGGLRGLIDSNNSLFSLTHLQTLVLSHNDFSGSEISPNFGRFPGMIHLQLSYSDFAGQVPPELGYLSNLHTLGLVQSPFDKLWFHSSSSLIRIISNLTNLVELRLSGVNMFGVLSSSFMNLSTSLTSLYLSSCELQGVFPQSIFHLPNLLELDLADNADLTGFLPKYNWTSQLRYLSLSRSQIIIDLPHLIQTLKYLNVLAVNNCNLTGKFSEMLGNTTQISTLFMSDNYFGGRIPWNSLNLENLTDLDLSANNFIGTLPEICRNSTRKQFLCDPSTNQSVGSIPLKLQALGLKSNFLNGTIPSWLYSLPSLRLLYLSNNHLAGQIKEFQFKSLVDLVLSSNQLQGPIPRSIFQQVDLSLLHLSSNNLSGVVKMEQFSKLKNLQFLKLSSNRLSLLFQSSNNYTLPKKLSALLLSSCNISEFPFHIRSLENLFSLDLSYNQIQGSIPPWMWDVGKNSLFFFNVSHNFLTHISRIPWNNLQYIDLRSNQLQGLLPIPPLSTLVFFVSDNHLSGEISTMICNLSSIEVLDLSNNSLSGNIPLCIGNSSNSLSVLDLRMNKFVGLIPSTFSNGNSLTTLNLNGNMLEGPLSRSILNCQSLEVLDVGNNKLNGTFPQWLESLPQLQVLILRSNRFHGSITNPHARFPFQKLRIMDISGNKFTGSLPAKYLMNFKAMIETHTNNLEYMGSGTTYYQDSVMVVMKGIYIELAKIQKMFITIDFSGNTFTGEIPEVIGELKSLKGLNLSHNNLTGLIPTSLGNLRSLEWLDLSSNKLVGKIPWQLAANLYQLAFINLSINQLEGLIPHGPQFDTFNNDSYSGNLGLCGFPLSKSCGERTSEYRRDDQDHDNNGLLNWKIVMMGYASGLVIGVSLGYIVFFGRRFDHWLAKRIRRSPQRRHKTIARFRSRGRN